MPSPLAPRQKPVPAYHHGNLKTALKDAALTLVREKGPRGFSLNEASRRAGVTPAAPYRHYKDKNALLAEIICDGNARLTNELQKAANTQTDVREQMLAVCLAYLRFAADQADYFALIFGSGIDKTNYPDVRISAQNAFGVFTVLAERAESSPERARERAVSCWALVHGLATLSADGAFFNVAQAPQNEDVVKMIRRAVASPAD